MFFTLGNNKDTNGVTCTRVEENLTHCLINDLIEVEKVTHFSHSERQPQGFNRDFAHSCRRLEAGNLAIKKVPPSWSLQKKTALKAL